MKYHNTAAYILNPMHPVTVNVIGCGGTGSQVMQYLGRMQHALVALGHPGLDCRVWDPDTVTEANLGRQLYTENDIGNWKSWIQTERINRFFGVNWSANFLPWNEEHNSNLHPANITITCVDNFKARLFVNQYLKDHEDKDTHQQRPFYWIDCGNSNTFGQVIIGSIGKDTRKGSKRMKTVIELYGDSIAKGQLEDVQDQPSCSLAEALIHQDLMICPTIATYAMQILWKLFRTPRTNVQGLFLNLSTYSIAPIYIK